MRGLIRHLLLEMLIQHPRLLASQDSVPSQHLRDHEVCNVLISPVGQVARYALQEGDVEGAPTHKSVTVSPTGPYAMKTQPEAGTRCERTRYYLLLNRVVHPPVGIERSDLLLLSLQSPRLLLDGLAPSCAEDIALLLLAIDMPLETSI